MTVLNDCTPTPYYNNAELYAEKLINFKVMESKGNEEKMRYTKEELFKKISWLALVKNITLTYNYKEFKKMKYDDCYKEYERINEV